MATNIRPRTSSINCAEGSPPSRAQRSGRAGSKPRVVCTVKLRQHAADHVAAPQCYSRRGLWSSLQLHCQVRKGEKGISIIAPIANRIRVEDEISDRFAGDDPDEIYSQLVTVAHPLGFTVEEDYFDGSRNADCNHSTKAIPVEVRNEPAQRSRHLRTNCHMRSCMATTSPALERLLSLKPSRSRTSSVRRSVWTGAHIALATWRAGSVAARSHQGDHL
jgi:hypothetical protein